MPTVSEPLWEHSVMPGAEPLAFADTAPPSETAAAARPEMDLEAALLLANRAAALQRVVTQPRTKDRAFLRDIRGIWPSTLSDKQRAHVGRLAWRYRFQLPPGLRPACDPDKPAELKVT